MRTLKTILFTLITINLLGQVNNDRFILTKEQNSDWLSKLENLPLENQLSLIRERLLLDTNVYSSHHSDVIYIQEGKVKTKTIESYGQPLMLINDFYPLNISNNTDNKSILELTKLLTDKTIKQVTILKDAKAIEIYGQRAIWGVVILTTKDKKTLKQINKIDFGRY